MMQQSSYHKFHIPVMGLAYTIDSPVKVAQYGIASVVSIVEDKLVEMMRSYYYPTIKQEYKPITEQEHDYRAKRITDYLNLMNTIVHQQVEKIRKTAFEAGSEIVKYFEMLPEDSKVKKLYREMMATPDQSLKSMLEAKLRAYIKPGSIDVNIMTKVDRNNFTKQGELIVDGSDAVTALRGYVKSDLVNSSVVFSAGMNPRLFNYMESCNELHENENGVFAKKVVIKVSDYRSALIQGKYLAKKGIWVSEFRIESGLNCGGHAFATDGYLMGPILEEFKTKRQELTEALFEIYNAALQKNNKEPFAEPPAIQFSAQGGIGDFEEDSFLHDYYNIDSTGWGTPFLLVPEATTVDDDTLQKLSNAKKENIVLSKNSPLGVRFHYLKGTTADQIKQARIQKGKPGSPCSEKLLAFNTEFTDTPICTASFKYQRLKIAQLQSQNLPADEYEKQLSDVTDKECLCVGLSNTASIKYDQPFFNKRFDVNVCPGPNIVNFSEVVSLQTMTDHIYGRKEISMNKNRPHMFIAELQLYVDYISKELSDYKEGDDKKKKYFESFMQQLFNGIDYYRTLPGVAAGNKEKFLAGLEIAEQDIVALCQQYELAVARAEAAVVA